MLFDVKETKGIFYQTPLNMFIDLCVVIETRTLIDFKQPGLQLFIQHYVKPKYLKALSIIRIAGFSGTCFVVVL